LRFDSVVVKFLQFGLNPVLVPLVHRLVNNVRKK
jgi:hypothetical protein